MESSTSHYRLIEDSTNPHLVDQISLTHLGVPIAFSLALICGLFGLPFMLSFTWIIIPLLSRYARRRYARRVAESGDDPES